MSKISLYNTSFAQSAQYESQAINALKYIIFNRANILANNDIVNQVLTSKIMIPTTISTIFSHLLIENKIQNIFTLLNLNNTTDSIPEILTLPAFILDIKQTKGGESLTNFKELNNKICINISNLLKIYDKSKFIITDMHAVYSLYVKGALTASYNDFTQSWLTPQLQFYIAKVYSMVISGIIQRIYLLDVKDQLTAATVLAAYVCYLMNESNELIPPQIYTLTFLGNKFTIKNIVDEMTNLMGNDDFTFAKACAIISELGSEKLKNLGSNVNLILKYISALGSDQISSIISVDYPAYFVHQILTALPPNNVKNGLSYQLKQHKLIEDGKVFAYNLNTCNKFIPKLER